MPFVDDDVLPLDLAQSRLVVQDVLVSSQHDVELFVFQMLRENRTLILLPLVGDYSDRRRPSFELTHPVVDRCKRHNNQERSFVALVADQISEERYSLDGFAETHFICENAIQVVVVQRNHPVEAEHLVLFELAALKQMRLLCDVLCDRVRDLVVHLAAVAQCLLDPGSVSHLLDVVIDLRRLLLVLALSLVPKRVDFEGVHLLLIKLFVGSSSWLLLFDLQNLLILLQTDL